MPIPDTWFTRELAVLEATVALWEEGQPFPMVYVRDIAARAGMQPTDVFAALSAMEGEYLALSMLLAGGSVDLHRVSAITPAARRAVGQWPTPESLADKLIAALQQAAADEPDPERRSKLATLAQDLGSAARDITVQVIAGVINAHLP